MPFRAEKGLLQEGGKSELLILASQQESTSIDGLRVLKTYRYAKSVTSDERKKLIAKLRLDAELIAPKFRLRYAAIQAENKNVKNRYGVCFSDGVIRIRLSHVLTTKPLKYSSLVNTLCHELAHLRHFNHGPSFQQLYHEILEYARDRGIYRPEEFRKDQPKKRDNSREIGPKQLRLL